MIGHVLDHRYRLDAELGRGGMGVVYRAHDTLLDRDVAVKVLSSTSLGTEGRARLLREAQAAARLNHPNVVTVHDAGQADGPPFIVMELVEGASLRDRRPEGLEEILSVARQVCVALEHAHAHGIVHRDLKPGNVLIALDGTVKLADFGLARTPASRLTQEGTIVGTVFYLSPEQALGEALDGRTDLYALGVMLYEWTTGQLPFTGDDPLAVISQHLHAPVVPPRARSPEIPLALDALIVRLLSKQPAGRPASAAQVREALERPECGMDAPAALLECPEELSLLDRMVRGRMVGREGELAEARALWGKAVSGEGQVLLISGEPGIGKTRLVRELVAQVQVSGGRALVGASYAEGGAPYAPFAQILRAALEDGFSDGLDLPEPVLADLLTLAPALRLRYPGVAPNPALSDPRSEQYRLFGNVVIYIIALSDRAPLLLVLEDAHWADSGTLSLLRHLARHTRRQRVMIVATYREVELDEALPFHEVLLDLQRERLATRLKLPRLGRAQAGEMLATLFDEEITPEFLEGIYRETEGNPFFIEEVCKALVESGKLRYQDGRWHRPSVEELGIPQSVRVAIQSRVRVLSADVQETLRQAAVLGREFDFRVLVSASERDRDLLFEALEDAERAQLIERVGDRDGGSYAFAHGLIASTLVEGIRILQRRRLHRQAAAAIEALHAEAGAEGYRGYSLEVLAHHCGEAGEAEKATEYLLRAGDQARGLYALQDAIEHYRRALEYLQEGGDLERAARTFMKLGLTYHHAFDFAAARHAYDEGFALWQRAAQIEPVEPPPAPHPLRVAVDEPLMLDPGLATDVSSGSVIRQVFSGLAELSPEMSVVPDVARRWEVLDGGRTYVFSLRDDVYWSDGVPVTAEDFEYAWKRVLDPLSTTPLVRDLYDIRGARAYHQGEVAHPDQVGVRAPDPATLSVELEGPTSYFPYLLTQTFTFPVPRHVVQMHGSAWTELGHIVTNGPFRLVAWEQGESMVLEHCPTYHGRFRGNLLRVELSFGRGESTRFLEMYEQDRLETVDLFHDVLSDAQWNHVRQRYAGEFVSGPELSTFYVGFNARRTPFDDRRVRRAFALATDRETLAEVRRGGFVFPATGGFVPPGMAGHSPGIGLPYDPEGARRLLAEAGYPGGRGFPAVEASISSAPGPVPFAEYLQAQWQENLGLEITLKRMAFARLRDELTSTASRIWFIGWFADYPDPDNFLRVSRWKADTGWRNDLFEELVEGARRIVDQGERIKMYGQADRILVEESPIVPLLYGRFHLALKPWVRRYPTSPMGQDHWKDVIIEPH